MSGVCLITNVGFRPTLPLRHRTDQQRQDWNFLTVIIYRELWTPRPTKLGQASLNLQLEDERTVLVISDAYRFIYSLNRVQKIYRDAQCSLIKSYSNYLAN